MSLNQKLIAKYRGNPVLLLVAAVGFTFSLYGFYNYGYKPWNQRKRFKEAEQFANFIYEKENQKTNV